MLLAVEELKVQIEEERRIDERCRQLDETARDVLTEHEKLTKQLVLQRKLRKAEIELEEACMVTSFTAENEKHERLAPTSPPGPFSSPVPPAPSFQPAPKAAQTTAVVT